MENIIIKTSKILSFILVFVFSAYFYFNYKGFIIDANGNIVLQKQEAVASPKNGIATILPNDLNINASKKFAEGQVDAPLTLYEYSSLGCPHCADFHLYILPELRNDYINKGLLRVIFVNLPLDKKSMNGALLLQCASVDNYHGFLDKLFSKQRFWLLEGGNDQLLEYAEDFGISNLEAKKCMSNDVMAQSIIADRQQGIKQLKMQGTPAFLFMGKDGNEIIYGVPSYGELKRYINSRLERIKQKG